MSAFERAEIKPRTERSSAARKPPASGDQMRALFDRLPPHSEEAEMALLGSLLLDQAVMADVLPHVKSPDAFYSAAHAAIFQALVQLYESHQSGDLVQLGELLKDAGELEPLGGMEYLVRLAESSPSATNAVHYARIVSDKSRLRMLIDAAGQIIYEGYHTTDFGPDGAREVLDRAEQLIFDIAEQAPGGDSMFLKDLLQEVMDHLEANEGRLITGLDTGYHRLNEMTSGFQPGELIIVAARPSMGKTALALNLLEQVAIAGGHGGNPVPAAIFSLEMGRHAVTQRMMCARAGVDSHLLRTNMLREEHYRSLIQTCGVLGEAPIHIDDTPGMTVLQLRARARRLAAQHDVRCFIVDYLQLLTAPGSARESRQVEVSAISRGIKALARELHVPIICLAQLNRGAEQREGHRPRMSDLRESGSIEQDADVIMLLHREEYYHQHDPDWTLENPEKEGLSELIIAKQRNGPTGTVDLLWDPKTMRFRNHAGRREAAAAAERRERPTPAAPAYAPQDPAREVHPGGRDAAGRQWDADGDDVAGVPF